MKFSIGDIVLLQHTGEEGVITEFLSPDMVLVHADGTEFPVHMDDLSHPYLAWFTQQKKKQPKLTQQIPVEKPVPVIREPKGISLLFMPVFTHDGFDEMVSSLKIFLVNELPDTIICKYDVRIAGQSIFQIQPQLHPFSHLYLHEIAYANMNDRPRFQWELSTQGNSTVKNGVTQIKPSKLASYIHQLRTNQEASFSILLIKDFQPEKKLSQPATLSGLVQNQAIKPAYFTPQKYLQNIEQALQVLDLHKEKLAPAHTSISPQELFDLQLQTVRKYIDLAILQRQEHMIIIHGLGKGVLKDAVHTILGEYPAIARYTNEWHGKYGFGATEVWFSYT
jgi:hypothetical protein